MNLSSGPRKPRIMRWLHLYLSIGLLVSLPEAGQAQRSPDGEGLFGSSLGIESWSSSASAKARRTLRSAFSVSCCTVLLVELGLGLGRHGCHETLTD